LYNSLRLLRSDVLRKQLLDVDPLSPLPGKYYENERYGRLVYSTLHEVARIAVDAGDLVLLDATYTRAWQRAALEAIVGRAEFQGYWLEASFEERLKRLTIRSNDPSDAGPELAAEQHIERPVNEAHWECIDAGGVALHELAEILAARICRDKPK
jgi:predicted kinase